MTGLKTGTLFRCLLMPFAITFAAMVINGCGGGVGTSKESPTLTPNISLLPAQTDFGVVVLGKSADKNIEIRNTGNGNLSIGQITQNNPASSPFSMIGSCSNAVIPPSSSCVLTIRFAPTTQDNVLVSFDIPSNDSDAGILTATLAGTGRALNVSINRVTMVDPQTVQVIVSVRDGSDNTVSNLAKSNFSIVENGSPKSIDNVSNIIRPRVSVGMVLDYSFSTIDFTSDLETAAKSFVDLLDPVNDEAEVIKFAALIAVMQPFTDNQVALNAAIDAFFPFTRFGTVLYDTIWTSINSLSLRSSQRHAIIAVSDGRDDAESIRTMSEVTAGAVDNNVQIFPIGVGNADNVSLQKLATDTGGQYFYAPTLSELTTVYSTISKILSNEYTIEYTTSSAAGSTISLDVKVDDNGQLGEYSRTVDL